MPANDVLGELYCAAVVARHDGTVRGMGIEPVFALGDPEGNGLYVWVGLNPTQGTLWVSVRHLVLTDARQLAKPGAMLRALLCGPAPVNDVSGRSVDNLLYLIRCVTSHREVNARSGMSMGYHRLVYKHRLRVTRPTVTAQHKPVCVYPPAFLTAKASVVAALKRFVMYNTPIIKHVRCVGFSLGAGVGLAAAHALAAQLSLMKQIHKNMGLPQTFHSYQFAGPRVGTSRFRATTARMGIRTTHVALKHGNDVDPISDMPFGCSKRVHVADNRYVVDTKTGVLCCDPMGGSNAVHKSVLRLVVGFLTGRDLGSGYTGFMRAHQEGDVAICMALEKVLMLKAHDAFG